VSWVLGLIWIQEECQPCCVGVLSRPAGTQRHKTHIWQVQRQQVSSWLVVCLLLFLGQGPGIQFKSRTRLA
jgi:hypothetical protein